MNNKILKELIYENAMVYPAISCWGDKLGEMEHIITKIVTSLDQAGFKLNGAKSCFLALKLEILGHRVESGLIKPDYNKLN